MADSRLVKSTIVFFGRWGLLATFVFLFSQRGWSQSISGMAGQTLGVDPQVMNGVQAVEEVVKGPSRGASGTIANLLTSSDRLICSKWLIDIYVEIRDMADSPFELDDELYQALQNLRDILMRECDPILNPEPYEIGFLGENAVEGDRDPPLGPLDHACPECADARRAAELATVQHEQLQWQLAQAMRETDRARATYDNEAITENEAEYVNAGNMREIEQVESQLRAQTRRAKLIASTAHDALVRCLEDCHRKISFLGNNLQTYALGGAAAVGLGVGLRGGGETEPSPFSGAQTPTSSSIGDVAPNNSGVSSCAGTYDVAFTVLSDPGGHAGFIGLHSQTSLTVTEAPFQVNGAPPFVAVNGTVDPNGMFRAQGTGTVAGIDNVTVQIEGQLSECGSSSGMMSGRYSMGIGGELPGGEATTYSVSGSN